MSKLFNAFCASPEARFCFWLSLSTVALTLMLAGSPAIGQGRRTPSLVQEHCAACHALGRAERSPHPAAPPLKTIAASHDLDRLKDSLRSGTLLPGHPDMPLFKLDDESAKVIINYLREIQE